MFSVVRVHLMPGRCGAREDSSFSFCLLEETELPLSRGFSVPSQDSLVVDVHAAAGLFSR